jgi:ABC-type multidrug transport system fused ATPase/permease subunit
MKAFRFIIEILRMYPRLVLSNVATAVVMSLLGVLSIFSLTPIIDVFLYPDGQGRSALTMKVIGIFKAFGIPPTVPVMVAVFVCLVILTTALQIFGNMLVLRTKYALLKDLMLGSMQDFFDARWLFFSGSEQGKIYSTFNKELSAVGDGLIAIGTIFSSLVQMAILLVVPFYISWKITLLCLGFGGGISLFFIFLSRSSYHLGQKNTDTANVVSGLIYENISGAKLVLGYGNSKPIVEKIQRAYNANLGYTILSQLLPYSISTSYRPVGVVIVLIVLLTSRSFGVPVSEVTVLLLTLLQVIILFGSIVAQKSLITNIVPGYEQIQQLRRRAREMKQFSGHLKFEALKESITLEQVSFFYPGGDKVLSDINLTIPKGKTVAFVGKSGVGKSTLVDILMGFHEPVSGRVLVDGTPLEKFNIVSYRRHVGYVPQDSVLFNMTIRDNFLWAVPDAGDAEIREACRMAYADEFIDPMPQGYDTVVGDRGVRLSGGQIQRLSLARAFLKKPGIFFLDEATSSLDGHSEILIQKAIEKISGSTTIVVIAHKLATIKRADRVYVLDKGMIVESGTYQELGSKDGYFSQLASFQELGIRE